MKPFSLCRHHGLLGIFIATVFLFSFPLHSSAQKNDCKLTNITDQFTDEVRTVSPEVFFKIQTYVGINKPDWFCAAYFLKRNDSLFLAVKHFALVAPSEVIGLALRLSDGTKIIKSRPSFTFREKKPGKLDGMISAFAITKEELEQCSKSSITMIKGGFATFPTDPVFEGEVGKKKSEKLQHDATCFVSEMTTSNIAKL